MSEAQITKTPRNRAFFSVNPECAGRVSASADSVAVEGAWGELVSVGGSLLSRENAGNLFSSGLV
jgi:hypothetical protein